MVTAIRKPTQAIAPFVDALWYVEETLPPGLERKLPTGAMQIVVNLREDSLRWYEGAELATMRGMRGAGLCGPILRPVGIDTAEQQVTAGVSFRPGGTTPFFDPPASVLAEPIVELHELWGDDGATLRERLLEQATPRGKLDVLERLLLDRLSGPPDPGLARAVTALDTGATVGQVIDRLGATASTFNRRFRAAVGLTPKRFARARRLQRVLRAASFDADIDWAATAAEHGFFDQAHLINDFRLLTGVTPSRYRPRSAAEHNHVPLDHAC